MAVSDPTRTIASPHSTVEAAEDSTRPPSGLLELIRELEPSEIVVGIPVRMDGTEGDMAREARQFGRSLAEATGIPVVEWDERLSTVRAEREIVGSGLPRGRRQEKGLSDRVAASLILRSYLQTGGTP